MADNAPVVKTVGNIELTMDTVAGTAADLGSQTAKVQRGILARYVNLSAMPDPQFCVADIFNAIQATAGVFNSNAPGFKNLKLTRVPITPLGAGQFRCQLVYENVNLGGMNFSSAYIREDDTVVQGYPTQFLPITREPIVADYIGAWAKQAGALADDVDKFDAKVPEDYITMNLLRPVRTLRVTQVRYGAPKDNIADAVGCVNGDVFLGKQPGYWMLMGYRTIASKYEGYYTSIITAYTKNRESWREYGALRHQQSGRYCPVPRKQVELLRTLPYSANAPTVVKKGFTHAGVIAADPYPVTSFRNIFGFST